MPAEPQARPEAYLKQLGERILSEANDLKRTPDALADEIGMPLDRIEAVIGGKAEMATARAVIDRMVDVYPISLAALWYEPDDTDRGARIMRAEDSAQSSRVFSRRDRDGAFSDYYEYRDTAMSRTAPFKPEWIKELRVVGDNDPDNPDVAYNHGHLMHQCTFFIGEVNFYWETGGQRHCAEMNTGDSNYVMPFVPHSFASRNPDQPGLIIAVTYGGQVRAALDDFARMGAEAADRLAGDKSSAEHAFRQRLARYAAAESLSDAQLTELFEDAGLKAPDADALVAGRRVPTAGELAVVAAALELRPEDLMVTPVAEAGRVIVRRAAETEARAYPASNRPAYRMRPLARFAHQPGLRGFDIEVLSETTEADGMLCHGLHEYVYNYGEAPVEMFWADAAEAILAPGDSAYVRPMVRHGFRRVGGAAPGRLATVRIPGALNDALLDEYATFPQSIRHRATGETKKWF